jgi:hypothetical protein
MKVRHLAAVLLLTSTASVAIAARPTDAETRGDGPRTPPPSMEHFAMGNILAELLSQQTGRPAAEIAALIETTPPPQVAEQLGLDPDAVKTLFGTARSTLIQRAVDAGLISSEQAEKLRTAPRLERHMHWRRPPTGN